MKKGIRTLFLSMAALVVAMLPIACSEEVAVGTTVPVVSKAQATFTVQLPGEFSQTRALTEPNEMEIQTADIISFRKDAVTNNEYFFYREMATFVSNTASAKVYRSSIQHSNDAQQFVVFANVRTILDGLSLNTSMTRQQVLNAIVMTQSAAWDVSSTYTPLPMWAQADYQVVNNGDPGLSVELTRAVARIDVTVASAAQSDFVMKSVRYYNYPNKGSVAPLDANWSPTLKQVTAPSVPSGGYSYAASPQVHTVTGGVSLLRTIYSFEAPSTDSNTNTSASCLVVGGSFKGGGDTYYRVDFYDQDTGEFLPLLRNFRYNVQITEVNGVGFSDFADALKAGFSNMTATTHVLDEGGMGNVVWDGRDFLSVSQTDFSLYPEEQSITVDVATTYADGWSATVSSEAASWLSIQGSSTGAGNKVKGVLTLEAEANLTGNRTGTVTITAGRLTQTITVFQSINPELSLEVNNVEFIFPTTVSTGQDLLVEWLPAAHDCTIELVAVSGYDPLLFTGHALSTIISDDHSSFSGGTATVTITPDDVTLADFEERRSILRISTTDVNNTPITKEVLLRQFDYTLVVSGTREEYDHSTTYSINVKSNALWEVAVSNTSLLNITSTVKGYADYTTGETVTFKTGSASGTVTLTFKSKEGLFPTKMVDITVEELLPNCYIVNSGNPVSFSISGALKAWQRDRDLSPNYSAYNIATGTRSVSLLWQDEPGLITIAPTINSEIITVYTTAGKEGNAVVALSINGTIRWSWHIWVLAADNDPTTYTYTNPNNGVESMNRNLGATLATPTIDADKIKTHGLMYQHGRKDPFPGANATTGTTTKTIYDISNTPLPEDGSTGLQRALVAEIMNLINAIENPLTIYYLSSGTNQDWYTELTTDRNSTDNRLDLWPYANKSYFDPCPKGWRVPKPYQVWQDILPPGTTELSSTSTNNGIQTSYGYFPAAGQRSVNGTLGSVGINVYQYDSSPADGYGGVYHYINSTSFVYSGGTNKTAAMPVRCVRIQ